MFVRNLHYVKPLEAVEQALPAHIAYPEKHQTQGAFLCSGRKTPRTGGVILCKTASREEAERIVAEDPCPARGIAACGSIEFAPRNFAEGLAPFLR